MIGQIQWGEGLTAELDDSGQWKCADESMTLYLNARFSPRRATGVDVVFPFGFMALQRAAAALGAKVRKAPHVEPLPPDVVS